MVSNIQEWISGRFDFPGFGSMIHKLPLLTTNVCQCQLNYVLCACLDDFDMF